MASTFLKTLKRYVGTGRKRRRLEALYTRENYLDAYSRHTDLRVEKNPHEAIGGHWEEMGLLQFHFLVDHRLEPGHHLLDIGCGTLRGGRHFIRYLDAGHYTGIDISAKALAYAEDLLPREGLSEKAPKLLLNEERQLRFSALEGQRFDVLLAQSVFTHLPPDHIETCFRHARRIMAANGRFFFTFFAADDHIRRGLKDFSQPWSFYRHLAAEHGYHLEDRSKDYPHPSGQSMACLTLVARVI